MGRARAGLAVPTLTVAVIVVAGYFAATSAVVRRDAVPVGVNPHPVTLRRPATAPLSSVAALGREIFFDSTLSASGRVSCSSCHSPDNAYASPRGGGPLGNVIGVRAIPSLRYGDRTPPFAIGPDDGEREFVDLAAAAALARTAHQRSTPRGGLFWDGRATTLQDQSMGPLLGAAEMGNGTAAVAAQRLRGAPYASRFPMLFGPGVLESAARLVDEAMFAVVRFQIEDSSFHPYASKYDLYVEGRAELTAAEARGLAVFEDTSRGACSACHTSRPGQDGTPPTFTDYEYEALGAPRNMALTANRNPRFFDLGLCGPFRTDLRAQSQYCGMFRTPSLRNVATRGVFFHNGVFKSLEEVVSFYNQRDARPEAVYPSDSSGRVVAANDLTPNYRSNLDTLDPPFGRRHRLKPALSDTDVRDLIAFLRTLTDRR